MRRDVTASLSLAVYEPSDAVLAIAVAHTSAELTESLDIRVDGKSLEYAEIEDVHGTRLHRFDAPTGALSVEYRAVVVGRSEPIVSHPSDLVRYVRPSRYSESDELEATALAEFAGLKGKELLDGVSSWVGTNLEYVPGSSAPTDGASQTYISRQGVCRDYAHLCVAFLRARGVPARAAAVYAPGLDPMDFHAVCEAYVDGRWLVVDATTLAPRQTLLRIATGRDAADTAFLTTVTGNIELLSMTVSAVADALPDDDVTIPVELG